MTAKCARETVSHPLQTFRKWDEKNEKGQESQKPNLGMGANLSPRQISARAKYWLGVYPKQLSNPRRMGMYGQCRQYPPFPGWALGSPRLEAAVGTNRGGHCKATGGGAIFLGKVGMVVTHLSLSVLSPDVNLFQEDSQIPGCLKAQLPNNWLIPWLHSVEYLLNPMTKPSYNHRDVYIHMAGGVWGLRAEGKERNRRFRNLS